MKIATFNINNINRRLPNLLAWLKTARPDVVCLQELKCEQGVFPAGALAKAGYKAVWKGQKTWNGVAILSRGAEPVVTRTALPGDKNDTQSRYVEAAIDGLLVGCIYLPNGNPQPGPKFDYKLAWFKRLHAHARRLLKAPVILAGDYNVAPTGIDIYPTTSWDDDALVQPQSRAAYARLVNQGWTDALRTLYSDERIYTFWHYWRNSWQRNAGLRIDHLLLSPSLAKRLRPEGWIASCAARRTLATTPLCGLSLPSPEGERIAPPREEPLPRRKHRRKDMPPKPQTDLFERPAYGPESFRYAADVISANESSREVRRSSV